MVEEKPSCHISSNADIGLSDMISEHRVSHIFKMRKADHRFFDVNKVVEN